MKYLSQTSILYYRWQNTWLTLQSIMANLARQDDLTSLIQWTVKKKLKKVQRAYQWKFQETEARLGWYRMRNRSLVTLCEFLFCAYKQLISSPGYYKRGSAAQYRLV